MRIALALLLAAGLHGQVPTFSGEVAPIIYGKCSSCHRPGQAAPFSLMNYQDVAKRGKLIASVTAARYMPPWKAEPGSYTFKDERRMTAAQIETIRQWVDGGMPQGDPAKSPNVPVFSSDWQLGAPDMVVEMPEAFHVPADGPDIYRNLVIPLNLPEQKWIRAIDLRPSARSVVHHVLFFADDSASARRSDAADPGPGFASMSFGRNSNSLGGWALGSQPHPYPEGIALPLPKNTDLVFQYHFHPSGKSEEEKSTIAIYFSKQPPVRTLTYLGLPPVFSVFAGVKIPAGEKDFRVKDSFVLPVDVEMVNTGAHAHYIGKEMKLTATLPSGEVRTILWIRNWDFAWQDRYFFNGLQSLPKGTRLDAEVSWDNSAANPRNPANPPVMVQWGEESHDEMGSVSIQVVPQKEADLKELKDAYRKHIVQSAMEAFRRDPSLKDELREKMRKVWGSDTLGPTAERRP
ncbi:MAG: hypothetical protein ABI693_28030 [Bryobacteraceae bacterium]